MIKFLGWYIFSTPDDEKLVSDKCGKWMYFFDNQEFALKMCQKAIDEHVCVNCKCTDMEAVGKDTGVLCFYLNGDDIDNHKRVISFMLENNLIPRKKNGLLYNNSFKFDDQTRAGEYGADFEGKIKLERFINLGTGEWIYE